MKWVVIFSLSLLLSVMSLTSCRGKDETFSVVKSQESQIQNEAKKAQIPAKRSDFTKSQKPKSQTKPSHLVLKWSHEEIGEPISKRSSVRMPLIG